jgi:AcrR family transcriptional regulator
MQNGGVATRYSPATGSLKERQRAERATLILDAAQEIFAKKGYHAASIEEIAAHVGISKGAVYLHYASKEALLEAIFARQISGFIAMVDDVAASGTSVRVRLERILAWVYDRMGGEYGPLVLELSALGLPLSAIDQRPALHAQAARATERLAALIDEGQRAGELDAAIPTPVLVALFAGLLSSPGFAQLLASGHYAPAGLVAYVSRTFFNGAALPAPTNA